jgi:hypothetical protein
MTQPIRNLRLRSFTASALASTTANNGDVYYDSTAKTLRIFDAATVGGTALARADLANVTNSTVSTKVAASGVLTWNNITGKPQFSTVSTSGQYSDLSGKPTIPSLGSVTVTGTAIDSTDSSAISFTPAVVFNSDITVENDITVRGELRTQSGQRYATETLVNSLISQAPIDYNNLLNLPAAFLGLSDLQMSVGVAINEFSIDPTFADNSTSAVPTESAVRTYIDRRLGFEADGTPLAAEFKIGPEYAFTEDPTFTGVTSLGYQNIQPGGSTQGTATEITANLAHILNSAASGGIILPAGQPYGTRITVRNSAAGARNVYPPIGEEVQGAGSVDAALSQPGLSWREYIKTENPLGSGADLWWVLTPT